MSRYAKPLSLLLVGLGLGWIASVARYGLELGFGPPGPPPALTVPQMRKAGLSEEQIKQVETITEPARRTRDDEKKKMEALHEDMKRTLGETKDPAVLREKFDALSAARTEMDRRHFETMLKVHEILSLDQIRRLAQ